MTPTGLVLLKDHSLETIAVGNKPRKMVEGKVVVITGASGAIGGIVARLCHDAGAQVVLAARSEDKLKSLASELDAKSPGRTLVIRTDVTSKDDNSKLLSAAIENFKRVDVVVLNAGRGITKSVLNLTDDDVDSMFRDNYKSVLYGFQVFVPYFLQHNKNGQIVVISSLLGRLPHLSPSRSAYSAAKAAVSNLTVTMRIELAHKKLSGECDHDIVVSLVTPGLVATPFGTNSLGGGPSNYDMDGAQDVKEVGKVIFDAIKDKKLDVYTREVYDTMVRDYIKDIAATESKFAKISLPKES